MRPTASCVLVLGCACAALVAASPARVWAQACSGGLELTATQVGQDVEIGVTYEQFGSEGMHVLATRPHGGGEVEARAEIDDTGCSLEMPEPATGCGCWSLAGTVVDPCVPPGTHEYTVYEEWPDATTPEDPVEIGTVEITVTDTGDACLPEDDEDDGSCAVTGGAPRAPTLLLLVSAALVSARRRRPV